MKLLTAEEVHAQKVAELELNSTALNLTSVEAIAGALRRVASIYCPCTAATLVRGAVEPLRGLVNDLNSFKNTVEDILEALIAYGDIFEHRDVKDNSVVGAALILYGAPVSFVIRESGTVFLLGITSDHGSALPDDLKQRIEYKRHLRYLIPQKDEDLREDLNKLGLIEITQGDWLRVPQSESSVQHLSQINSLLDAVGPSREVPGLLLLDAERPVNYYRGRWAKVINQSGRFVARRSQAYGADLWCYVQLRNGNPERLIDFPLVSSHWRGCDEAWRVQIAIDAERENAQRYRIKLAPNGMRLIQFYSPIPMWARRRLDAIGEPISSPGCLFANLVPESELVEELQFVRVELWLEEMVGGTQ